MTKILANDGIHPDCKILLDEAGYEIATEKVPQDRLIKELPAYDAIIVRSATKVTKEIIDACPRLKLIARAGVGLDNIDVDHSQKKGIKVFNTPAASSQSVAELAFGHMFNLARHLHEANRRMPAEGNASFKSLKKQFSTGFQLRGKTLGIIGFGRIGQEVARIGLALGMNVMPVDLVVRSVDIDINLFMTEDISLTVKVPTFEFDEVLQEADFITLHVPFVGGKPLITSEEIGKMSPGVCLINTSRGGAIDEQALIDGLNSGKIAGAGIDVFENEPTPRTELLQHPRVSMSPHIGASTIEAQANIGLELADKILAFFGDDK